MIFSWLRDLCALEFAGEQDLRPFFVAGCGQRGKGRWTVEAAMREAIPANVLTVALFARNRSRIDDSFADNLLSVMRFGFGGHVEMPQ